MNTTTITAHDLEVGDTVHHSNGFRSKVTFIEPLCCKRAVHFGPGFCLVYANDATVTIDVRTELPALGLATVR